MKNKINNKGVELIQSKLTDNNASKLITSIVTKVSELVDIIDEKIYKESGEIKIKKVISKQKAHESPEFHQAGHIWIYNSKGEVLLQKRSKDKDTYPGLWDISAAGHISSGETMNEGSIRELKEELGEEGITETLKNNNLELIFTYIEDVKKIMKGKDWYNNELNAVYLLKYDLPIENLKMQKEEVEELKFISIEQFEKEINDPKFSKNYVLQRPEYYVQVISEIKNRLGK